ncbi:MAG: TetR/AcrR family transcriptional regulator [Sphingobacterium sp.]
MGSKERIQRQKDDNRINILTASLEIVKKEGWQALSMRKIADIIEYTAPMIYEYFANKEAILNELARQGFILLSKQIKIAKESETTLENQLEAMWLSYWDFAFEEKELYQLMFGVGTQCCAQTDDYKMPTAYCTIIVEVIRQIIIERNGNEETVSRKYFTFWSVIHGLISINLVNQGNGEITNQEILKDAISGITQTLSD